ncbi:MAG: amidohydrolase family protein [Bryobacteraceae bacterium]
MRNCFRIRSIKTFFCSLALAVTAFGEPTDWLLTARYVVTMDPSRRVIEDGAVAVTGSRIVAAGPRVELEKRFQPKRRLARPESLIAPGLINTHTHAPMSLLRGIADDRSLQEWLEKFIFPAEAKNVTPEFVRWGTRLAALEMLQSGTTTFTDMYYFEEVIAEAAKEAGIRGVLGQTVIGFPVADAKTPALALERTEAFLKRFAGDPLITAAVAPHAIYTTPDEVLRSARALANRYKAPLVIHLAETRREYDDVVKARSQTPTKALDVLGLWNGRSVAAHGVWLDAGDIAILKQRGVGVAHCPSSNMKLASGIAPVTKLLAAGVAVGLGPDGPAGSNNDFDLLEEVDLAAKLQKVSTMDPLALPAEAAFAMATIGGARVLGMESSLGSIETGKLADLIVVNLESARAEPLYDVYSHLAYVLKGSDVKDVFVNGRQVVLNGRVLTLDEGPVLRKAREYRDKIRASLE